ncbi:hypothetical protein P171DRAFT_478018 [Karstenula rhodostoma CBS 690.94]|uniref:Uncharacterized protein n=1 Tax=Karstenula rhodostoma CBS 690.94 TaxID=1392251 RepID=A0A9P4P6D1_9PLEO|nr:hypothetical protein P171DRAFT_478018 [Karstenula rhodostoma CBS 690.94]
MTALPARSTTVSVLVLSWRGSGRQSGVPLKVSDFPTVMGIGALKHHRGGASAAFGGIEDDAVLSYPVVAKAWVARIIQDDCRTGCVRWSPVKTPWPGTNGCGIPIQLATNAGNERSETASRDSTRRVGRQR